MFDSVTDFVRLANVALSLWLIWALATLPGGPTNKAYANLTLGMVMVLGTTAFSNVEQIGDGYKFRAWLLLPSLLVMSLGALRLRFARRQAIRRGIAWRWD